MNVRFSEDDVGKPVENADGMAIGVVATVDDETASVEPDPGVTDSIKAALGWELEREDTVTLVADDVREITDDAVHLEEGHTPQSGLESASDDHDFVADGDEDAGTRDTGSAAGGSGRATEGNPDPESETVEGDSSEERHPGTEDAPPDGERTVTDERGRHEDR